ncbi:rod-binding protein [Stakelama tenebrarum]
MDPFSLPAARGPQMPQVTASSPQAETAQQFEAVFLGQMFQLMLENSGEAGEFSGGSAEQVFRGVLAEKLGNEVAKRGGIGLAPTVMDQILRLQQGEAM